MTASSSIDAARCTVPAVPTAGSFHGMGVRSAQSTFTVAQLRWNRSRAASVAAGRCSAPTSRRYRTSASTSASTARLAPTGLPATSTPTARPPSTTMRSTRAPHATRPPAHSSRRTRAAVSSPAPPIGDGNPTSWPREASSHPRNPLGGASGGTSVCMALPASSSPALTPRNSSSTRRRTGRTRKRASGRMPRGPMVPSARSPGRTGGNGATKARSTAVPSRCQRANSRIHASPSPGASASRPAAVSSGDRCRTAAGPWSRGCATTAGACAQRRPWDSRSSAASGAGGRASG